MILTAHPLSAAETEIWRWSLVDRDAPHEVREAIRRRHLAGRASSERAALGETALFEEAQEASSGHIARRYDYNYGLGIGLSRHEGRLGGTVESERGATEENARNFYRHWAGVVGGEPWELLQSRRELPTERPLTAAEVLAGARLPSPVPARPE